MKRLVIVSSGAVSKPLSPVYILLNLVGKGIMKAKIEGENEVRKMYAALGPDSELGYTIVRPGGLTEEEPLGVKVFAASNPYRFPSVHHYAAVHS